MVSEGGCLSGCVGVSSRAGEAHEAGESAGSGAQGHGMHRERDALDTNPGAGGRLMRVFTNAAYAWREASFASPPLRAKAVPERTTAYPNPMFSDPAQRRRSATTARYLAASRAHAARAHSVSASAHSAFWFLTPRQRAAEGASLVENPKHPTLPGATVVKLLAHPAPPPAGGSVADTAGTSAGVQPDSTDVLDTCGDLFATARSYVEPEAAQNEAQPSGRGKAPNSGRSSWRAVGEALDAQVGDDTARAPAASAGADDAVRQWATPRSDSCGSPGTGRTHGSLPERGGDPGSHARSGDSWTQVLGFRRGSGAALPRPVGCLRGGPSGGCLFTGRLCGASRLGRRAVRPTASTTESAEDEEWGLPSVREVSAELACVVGGSEPNKEAGGREQG